MQFEYKELRLKVLERYGTLSAFAEALGCSVANVSKKFQTGSTFSGRTMDKWANALGIERSEYMRYFFA